MQTSAWRRAEEGREFIGVYGHLEVPVESSWESTPKREGWEPCWVAVNLSNRPQKWISYKRTEAPFSEELWQAYKNAKADEIAAGRLV